MGSTSVRAGTVVPGPSRGLGGRGPSCRGDPVEAEAEAGVGLGPAHGTPVLSGEGRVPGGVSEAAAEEGAPGSMGRVSGAGVTVVLEVAGGEGLGASFAGGAGESSGLWGRQRKAGGPLSRQQAGRDVLGGEETEGKRNKHSPLTLQRGGQAPGSVPRGRGPALAASAANALRAVGRSASRTQTPGHRSHAHPGTQPPHGPAGVTLTCWLATAGPESHEALCVHRCCQTHQLHPQRLRTQAWHLHRHSRGARGAGRGDGAAGPGVR